jgi:uncharacterized protein YjbJ (UPF0337 family)
MRGEARFNGQERPIRAVVGHEIAAIGYRLVRPCTRPIRRRIPMGLKDKAENTGDKLKGKAKEAEGRATGDQTRENQGKADQSKSDLKQAGENVKDAFKK